MILRRCASLTQAARSSSVILKTAAWMAREPFLARFAFFAIILAAGALAAASADTWATEVGTLWGGRPRSIISGRPVAPGMSGGITLIGTMGALVGSAIVAASVVGTHHLPWAGRAAVAAFAGGVAGALAGVGLVSANCPPIPHSRAVSACRRSERRGLDRMRLHADLTILAKLASRLAQERARALRFDPAPSPDKKGVVQK